MNTDLQTRCANYIDAANMAKLVDGQGNGLLRGLMIDLYADYGESVVDAEIKRQAEARRATQWLKH